LVSGGLDGGGSVGGGFDGGGLLGGGVCVVVPEEVCFEPLPPEEQLIRTHIARDTTKALKIPQDPAIAPAPDLVFAWRLQLTPEVRSHGEICKKIHSIENKGARHTNMSYLQGASGVDKVPSAPAHSGESAKSKDLVKPAAHLTKTKQTT
jgi:hypothetical protein